jgi:hypothetical protein
MPKGNGAGYGTTKKSGRKKMNLPKGKKNK